MVLKNVLKVVRLGAVSSLEESRPLQEPREEEKVSGLGAGIQAMGVPSDTTSSQISE